LQTESLRSRGVRACDDTRWIYLACEGKRRSVADQGPIARIAVLEGQAITIGLTLARDLHAEAGALLALICQGARITVIARSSGGRIFAATGLCTDVIGARVFIVALHGVSDAGSLDAVVGHGTWIAIFTRTDIKDLIEATLVSHAFVFCAIVGIVTEVDIIALHQVRFVNLPVTIIIHSVAGFQGRLRGIAA